MNTIRIKQHVKEHKEAYIVGASCLTVGASIGAVSLFVATGGHVQIVDSFKAVHIQYKSPNINVALVKMACPDPIPVLDKKTGIPYPSIRHAAKTLELTPNEISKDIHGAQEMFERLPDSVFA